MADTKGRTRAAKRKAARLIRDATQRDDEVDFHPRYSHTSSVNEVASSKSGRSRSRTHELDESEASTIRSMADSSSVTGRRVDDLERDVGLVTDRVKNMDEKLDVLLAAITSQPQSSTPRRARDPPQKSQPEHGDTLPPPRRLHEEVNAGGYVDLLLQQEKFRPPAVDGKTHLAPDIFVNTLLPKPYMYVTREGVTTVKQKLDIRTSLSPMEYVHAALKLANDARACDPYDREYILRHIQDVAHDAMERQLEAVRK